MYSTLLDLKRFHWLRVLSIVVILRCHSGLAGEPTTAFIFCVVSQLAAALCQLSPEVTVTAAALSYAAPFIYNRLPDRANSEMITYLDKSNRKGDLFNDFMRNVVIMTADQDGCRFIFKGTRAEKNNIDKVIDALNNKAVSHSAKLSFSEKDKNQVKEQLQSCTEESEVLIGVKNTDRLQFIRFSLSHKKNAVLSSSSHAALQLIFNEEKLSDILAEGDATLVDLKTCPICRIYKK